MRSIAIIITILFMVFTFVACSGGDSSESDDDRAGDDDDLIPPIDDDAADDDIADDDLVDDDVVDDDLVDDDVVDDDVVDDDVVDDDVVDDDVVDDDVVDDDVVDDDVVDDDVVDDDVVDDDVVDDDVVDDDVVDDDVVDDDVVDDDVVDDDVVDDDVVDDDVVDDDVVDDDVVDDDVVDDDVVDDDTVGDPPTVEILEPQDGQTYYSNEQPVNIAITDADVVTVLFDGDDVTDQLTITAVAAYGTIDGLSAGGHTLSASVENLYGWDFDEVDFNTQIDDPYLELTLSHYTAQIGDEVVREVHVFDEMGNDITSQVTLSHEIDPLDGFTQVGDTFTFERIDSWTFTSSCEYNGKVLLSDSEEHSSYDHVPDHITLDLSAGTVMAGHSIYAYTSVYNQFDDLLEDYPVSLTTDPGNGVTINNNQITFTIATDYTVTANPAGYAAITDQENVTVTPASPLDIDLHLSSHMIDAGETITYTVEMYDQYGNPWTSGWDIEVNPDTGVTVDEENQEISFDMGGIFTVEAQFYLLHDYESVTVTDNVPPTLTWTSPPRGTFTQGPSATLEGVVSDVGGEVESLTINGVGITFSDTGIFYLPVGLAEGYNIFTAVVEDSSGNTSSSSISILRGSYLENDVWVENALGVKVNPGGIDTVEEIAETYLNEEFDLVELVMSYNPLVDEIIDLGFIVCTVYAETTDVQVDPLQLDLALHNGYITAELLVTNFLLSVEATIDCVMDGEELYTGSVTADSFTASVPVYVDVVGGELQVTIGAITLNTTNFQVSISGIDPTLLAVLEAMILPMAEDMINEIIQEEIPPLIEEILSQLELTFDFELLDHTLTLEADFQSLDILSTGIDLWMDARTTADSYDPGTPPHPGSYYTYGIQPTMGPLSPTGQAYELGAALCDDAINQALYILYRAGVLTMTIDQGSGFGLDLTAGDLELFFPGISAIYGEDAPVIIQTQATLPPILDLDPADAAQVELQLGEFFIDLIVEPPTDQGVTALSMGMAVIAPASIEINATGDALSVVLGNPTVNLDIMETMSNLPDAFFEAFVPLLVQFVMPLIGQFLEEFPIPSFEGYSISITDLTTIGALDDYLGVFGNLVEVPPDWAAFRDWNNLVVELR